jgi:transcriptional regulator with XRE-family HTH domain
MNLGENIYKNRARCRLSQGDLADALEVSRQSVSKWENNSAVPELDKLIRMRTIFDISLDELVFDEKSQPAAAPQSSLIEYHLHTIVGLILLFFGLLTFLLSAFWGSNLVVGEQVGEMVSTCIILASIALLAPYNFKVMGICAVASFAYYVICFGMLDIRTMENMVFISFLSLIIWIWFFVLGTHASKGSEHNEPDRNCFGNS